ncbi:DUF669 domain-containing protein [Aerococcus urinae]|uniref:DUF669 domain-containing protein n=1 Tax=Aerococcus urinae TaxID=1376 RepID=UPI00254EFF01|nr:DUF669 domain-containing protein [Aerococcus urinae]MDK7716054.1 DUF669 domain-containing protein [Aerococcus urinae]
MFTYDENNRGLDPVKAGVYEVYANAYSLLTSQSGNEMVQFNYYIREDVDQPSKGSEIRYDNFVDTENSKWRWNALTHAIGGIPNGTQMTTQQWAEMVLGKPIKVKVELVPNSKGKEYPEVKAFYTTDVPNYSIAPKAAKPVKTQSKGFDSFGGMNQSSTAQADPFASVFDDNLPFK